MTAATLKKKIKALVDSVSDAKALQRVYDLLGDTALDAGQAAMLKGRLDAAEADFKDGRSMGAAEARKRLKRSLKEFRRSPGPSASKRA